MIEFESCEKNTQISKKQEVVIFSGHFGHYREFVVKTVLKNSPMIWMDSAKTPNKAKDDSEVAGRATVKPVRRRRKKRNSPSALARSRRRHARFLEKKLAGKPDSPSPEDQQDSVCVKELENTSLVCGSDRDLESSDNPTPAQAVEPDLLQERAVLFDFLAKTNIDSDESEDGVDCVCSNCKHPPKEGGELKRCSRCHITRYCSVQCQKKDWDFHRFACSVVAKVKSNA